MMNSPVTFPPAAPTLKLARPSTEKWAASLAEERRRLQEDQDALREREATLRDYETRLRALQSEIEASRVGVAAPDAPAATSQPALNAAFQRRSSRVPFGDGAALDAAWEKLHRARELFESEQAHLSEDRVAIHDQQESIKRKAAELAEREARIAERETLIAAAMQQPMAGEHTMSAITRLTTAPFAMARSVFRRKDRAPG